MQPGAPRLVCLHGLVRAAKRVLWDDFAKLHGRTAGYSAWLFSAVLAIAAGTLSLWTPLAGLGALLFATALATLGPCVVPTSHPADSVSTTGCGHAARPTRQLRRSQTQRRRRPKPRADPTARRPGSARAPARSRSRRTAASAGCEEAYPSRLRSKPPCVHYQARHLRNPWVLLDPASALPGTSSNADMCSTPAAVSNARPRRPRNQLCPLHNDAAAGPAACGWLAGRLGVAARRNMHYQALPSG